MIALITDSLKKSNRTQSNTNFCIFMHLRSVYSHEYNCSKKKHQKTQTLISAEKGQLNSVASCIRFSKDRLEQVQKHMI